MNYCHDLKNVLWTLIAQFALLVNWALAQTVTSVVVYQPYAFIDVVSPQGETDLIFDHVTDKIRSKSKIDEEDFQTLAYLREAADTALKRPPLQYVDSSGAKVKVVDAHFVRAKVPTLTIDLGYASGSVDSALVEAKVAELSQDAKEACDASGVRCSITAQFVKKPAVGDAEK